MLPRLAICQAIDFPLPKIEPSRVEPLRADDYIENYCVSNIFTDDEGRLWMGTCGVTAYPYMMFLAQHDGYQFNPIDIQLPGELVDYYNIILGYHSKFGIYGYSYRHLVNDPTYIFTYHPLTKELRVTKLEKALLGSIQTDDDFFWITIRRQSDSLSLATWDGNQIDYLQSLPLSFMDEVYEMPGDEVGIIQKRGDYIYHLDHSQGLLRFHLPNQTHQWLYRYSDLPKDRICGKYTRSLKPALFFLKDQIYFSAIKMRFNAFYHAENEDEPNFERAIFFSDCLEMGNLFLDQSGNALFVYNEPGKDRTALLLDKNGKFWDFSPMLIDLPPVLKVASTNFFETSYVATFNGGAFVIQHQSNTAIQQELTHLSIRRMGITKDNIYIVKPRGREALSKDLAKPSSVWTTYINEQSGQALAGPMSFFKDQEDALWMRDLKKDKTIYFKNGNWEKSFSTNAIQSENYQQTQVLPDGRIALYKEVDNIKLLFVLDRNKNELNAITFKGEPIVLRDAAINGSLVSRDGLYWLASGTGLYKINPNGQDFRLYGISNGFPQFRLVAIHEDQKGRLWLGTVKDGLILFDPEKEEIITVINAEKGLSNNSVVSILEDDDGDIWAGTFNGLNIVRPDGTVRSQLYEKDGLSNNEFNRFAYWKAPDGRLAFGTIQGLNIIDPKAIKQQLQKNPTSIYISELTYYDARSDNDINIRNPAIEGRTIRLAADKRYLKLKVAMSNYAFAAENRFAYRLEGIDTDWNYLGKQHRINLSNLPPGNYKLLVSGLDERGNWAKAPIVLNMSVSDYFYKQPWFYGLVSSLLILIALFWVYRLRRQKVLLEETVKSRTKQIRKDKALIEQQAEELLQLDQLKSRFFANISHELRTPLTLITGPAEVLSQEQKVKKDSALSQAIRGIYQNGKKLLHLVEEMLDLARIEARQIQLKESPLPLFPFCKEIFGAFQSKAKLQQIEYQLKYQLPDEYVLLVDHRRLEKILNNLLSNAMKFTPKGGRIALRIYQEQQQIYFEVQDSGRGIPEEDLPHIFERFFQSNRETLASEMGTGIGLSLSKDLAKLMEGELSAESSWGKGSTFVLRLPAKEVEPAKPESDGEQTTAASDFVLPSVEALPAEAIEKEGHILIVEDNPEVRAFVEQVLQSKYKVDSVEDGQQALDFLQKANNSQPPIDLIVSDITMPNLDGYGLLDAVKADAKLQQLPVVMLTARTGQDHKLRALRMGVDDYLTKPFSPVELLVRIENLLNNYRQRQQEAALIEVQPEFESEGHAELQWLQQVEEVAILALDKKLELTANYLANEIAISARQLSRKVKSLTGLSIGKYIQEVKLQKARHLLEDHSKHTIAEVAFASGFKSASHFSQLFAQRFGRSPSQYWGEEL